MRISAGKPLAANPGLPSVKNGYLFLCFVEDIAVFPATDYTGVILDGDIELKEGVRWMVLYLTPGSQDHGYNADGDVESRGFLSEVAGKHPGNEIAAHIFLKNILNRRIIAVADYCTGGYRKVFGHPDNPLYYSGGFTDNDSLREFDFNFKQAASDLINPYFYAGIIEADSEFPEIINPEVPPAEYVAKANVDASNIGPFVITWREALDVYSKAEVETLVRGLNPDSYTIGNITTTSQLVQLALSPDGTNSATIAGTTLSKTTPDSFPYTPVSPGKLKALVLYAKATAQIFYLAEGVQGDEAVSPDFEGLFIASITVSDGGQIVNPAGPQDFLYQSNDSWITQQITGAESLLVAGNNPGNTFDISVKNGTSNPGIAGITAEQKLFWEGRIFWLRNNSPVDIALIDTPVSGELTRFSLVQFEKPAALKKAGWAAVKIKRGVLVVIGLGGGASFPEGGARGDIIEWDAEGAVWTDRLTNAEAEIDAEVVNRAAADLQEKNERIAADALKQDKSLFSSLTDKFLHFYNATTQKLEPVLKYVAGTVNVLEFVGRIKADAFLFTENATAAIAMRLRSDGKRLFFSDKNGVEKPLAYAQANVFVYTPTGNFALSTVKTAMESAGYVFNDSHIIIILGTNNYTCSIDIGAANVNNLFTIAKRGTGSISFSSTRTLDVGMDNVTIMNGTENSMALIQFGTSTDFLTIRNR